MIVRHLIVIALGCGVAACSGGGADAPDGASGSPASSGTSNGGDGGAAGSVTASGGSIGTEPAQFTSVTELWIGAPDDSATTVVYAFSKPTACSLLSAAGWDAKLAPETQHIEMKEFGTGPGTYTVVTTKTPAPGEASVNFSSNASGAPVETSGSGGTVTLTALNAKKNATGSYAMTFGATPITGTFDATYCAGGVEP